MKTTLLTHCRVISPGVDIPNATVSMRDGRIIEVLSVGAGQPQADEVIDAGGAMVLPGFIDIHTHGAGGRDVCEADPEGLRTIARTKLAEGVTSFLPTTLTIASEPLEQTMHVIAAYMKDQEFARAPAVHVEGPFINPKAVGAQNPAHVRVPDIAELAKLHAIARVGIVSMAVEMPGGVEFVRAATALGIRCSLAHTQATHAQFLAAKQAGLAHLTHFCNQMTPLHHREIGIVGAGLLDSDILIEVICDRIHVCTDMLRLVFQTKPLRQMMLITDSIAASHLGDGVFDLGGLAVTVKNAEARLDSGALAGSTLRMNVALKNVAEITGLPLQELVATTAWNQAQSLGLPGLGKVEPGFFADLVLLDGDFNVRASYVGGERRYQAQG